MDPPLCCRLNIPLNCSRYFPNNVCVTGVPFLGCLSFFTKSLWVCQYVLQNVITLITPVVAILWPLSWAETVCRDSAWPSSLECSCPKNESPKPWTYIYICLYIILHVAWYHIKTSLDSYLSLYLMHLCVYLYVGTIEFSSGWVPPCKATRGWPGGEARESHHF